MPTDEITTRTCSGCGKDQPIVNFPIRRGKRYFRCRPCLTAQSLEWQARNRERSNAIKRKWADRNPEANQAAKKAYVASDSGIIKRRAWQQDNREKINTRNRELWHSGHMPIIDRQKRRRKAMQQAEGVFTGQDELDMLANQRGECAICGSDISDGKYHADHIIPLCRGGSHWPSNRQLLCAPCNFRKGAK